MNLDKIPAELQTEKAWVNVWNSNKIPMQSDKSLAASTSVPYTWSDFEVAKSAIETGRYDGLGYIFHNTGLVGIDIDAGFDEYGLLTPLAAEIIARCGSYTERSRSGRGVHILVKGKLPFDGKNNRKSVEIYQNKRYFILTGDTMLYDEIIENQKAIDSILKTHFATELLHRKAINNYTHSKAIYSPVYRVPENGKIPIEPDYYPIESGSRNLCLTSLAGQLHSQGYQPSEIYRKLLEVNEKACTPPLNQREVEGIVSSITRYRR